MRRPGSSRRAALTLTAALPVAVLLGVLGAPAHAGDTQPATQRVSIDLPPVRSMVAARGRLFVAASNSVFVLSPTGETLGSVHALSRPMDLAVSPDGGTVYVTSMDAWEIVLIDAETLTIRSRIPTVPCPRDISLSVRYLVYSHACGNSSWSGRVGGVDLTTGEPLESTPLEAGFHSPPVIAITDNAGVVAVDADNSPMAVSFTVTGNGFTEVGNSLGRGLGYPEDLAVRPGADVVGVSTGSRVTELALPSLETRSVYQVPSYASNVTYSHDGTLLVAAQGSSTPYFTFFSTSDGRLLASQEEQGDMDREVTMVKGTLTVAEDDAAVYAVTRHRSGAQWLVSAPVPVGEEAP